MRPSGRAPRLNLMKETLTVRYASGASKTTTWNAAMASMREAMQRGDQRKEQLMVRRDALENGSEVERDAAWTEYMAECSEVRMGALRGMAGLMVNPPAGKPLDDLIADVRDSLASLRTSRVAWSYVKAEEDFLRFLISKREPYWK